MPPFHTIDLSAEEILQRIGNRVKDVTSELDLANCEAHRRAAGGFGDVYFGYLRDGTPVAIKCLEITIQRGPEGSSVMEGFANEVYAWSKCNHPNIARLIGLATFRQQLAMISPWIGGLDLYGLLRTEAWTIEERYRICTQTVEAVAYLHKENIVHGDLKTRNILMSDEGVPQLIDFGCSIIREHSLRFRSSTRGYTVNWVAPEILEGSHPTHGSDVYSLGMTILEIMTGEIPYAGLAGIWSVVPKIVEGTLPDRSPKHFPDGNPQADHLWALLTGACWVRGPNERISAAELLEKMKEQLNNR
ncbi:hypothetical protein ACGC1H_000245 [Rhizoctonia solani]